MSFPVNTSPYGSGVKMPASPMTDRGTGSRGGLFQSLFGQPERNYQQSLLGPEQQQNYQNLQQAGNGAFTGAADYYRNNLSDNPADMQAFAAPELRRFNEEIIPGLSEQFSGYGGIGSSGFRNAAVNAGADLSERLGALRAQIRQQSAQGLQNIGAQSLQQTNENIHRPETNGLVGGVAEGGAKAAGVFLASKIPGIR